MSLQSDTCAVPAAETGMRYASDWVRLRLLVNTMRRSHCISPGSSASGSSTFTSSTDMCLCNSPYHLEHTYNFAVFYVVLEILCSKVSYVNAKRAP